MKPIHDTASLLRSLALAALILAAVMALTGCSLTIAPDGTRQWAVSGEEAARAVILYSGK